MNNEEYVAALARARLSGIRYMAEVSRDLIESYPLDDFKAGIKEHLLAMVDFHDKKARAEYRSKK